MPVIWSRLQALAALLVEATQEWVKALLHAAHAEDRSAAEDADDFLVAIDRIAALEHAADDAERALTATAVRQAADFRSCTCTTAIGAKLEDAHRRVAARRPDAARPCAGRGAGWLTPTSASSCPARRCRGRRRGGRQQGVEPDAAGAGRPAGAARLRAADRLVPHRRAIRPRCARRWPPASPGWKPPPGWASASARRPLLVSVRSGAAVSMPGHAGDGAGCRPERAQRRGADPADRQSAPGLGQRSPAGAGLCRSRGRPADRAVRSRVARRGGRRRGPTASATSTTAPCAV